VLKPTGSIYLHCDPTASHYLKLLMDAVFGPVNFRNEIVWKRTSARSDSHRWNHIHDVILFYAKSDSCTWHTQYVAYNQDYVDKFYRFVEPESGRRYASDNLTASGTREGSSGESWHGIDVKAKGLHWKYQIQRLEELDQQGRILWPAKKGGVPRYRRFLDEMPGTAIQSIIADIPPLSAQSAEKLGYPTQKPEALLERIIAASSNEGDLVLDPFCGCGTTVTVAERLKRRWIGIDITHLAISLMRHRLQDTFGPGLTPYEVIGAPDDLESARALAKESEHEGRYQFEWWALGLVDARPAQDKRKGADRGIDGYINFFDDNSGKAKSIIVQVKSGGVKRDYIATLNSDREREKAPIGILITLEEPTRPMLQEAIAGGFYEPEAFPGHQYQRLQILTIKELLEGKEVQYPRMAPPATFKRAQRHRGSMQDQQRLV